MPPGLPRAVNDDARAGGDKNRHKDGAVEIGATVPRDAIWIEASVEFD